MTIVNSEALFTTFIRCSLLFAQFNSALFNNLLRGFELFLFIRLGCTLEKSCLQAEKIILSTITRGRNDGILTFSYGLGLLNLFTSALVHVLLHNVQSVAHPVDSSIVRFCG